MVVECAAIFAARPGKAAGVVAVAERGVEGSGAVAAGIGEIGGGREAEDELVVPLGRGARESGE